jgi:hypothetical protein
MRYEVSTRFYNTLVSLLGIAVEDNNAAEIDLVMDLLKDTAEGQDS